MRGDFGAFNSSSKLDIQRLATVCSITKPKELSGLPAAIKWSVDAPRNAPPVGRPDQFPAIGRNPPNTISAFVTAEDDTMPACNRGIPIQHNRDGAQQMGATLCKKILMHLAIDQHCDSCLSFGLGYSADRICAAFRP